MDLDVEEANFLRLLNDYRRGQGLGPVAVEPHLQTAATWMAADLLVFNLETGQETELTVTPTLSEWSPAWSSDGLRVYFLSAAGGNADVHVIGIAGGSPVNLSASPAAETWISIGRIGAAASSRQR